MQFAMVCRYLYLKRAEKTEVGMSVIKPLRRFWGQCRPNRIYNLICKHYHWNSLSAQKKVDWLLMCHQQSKSELVWWNVPVFRQAAHLQNSKWAISQSKWFNMEVLMWVCISGSCETKGTKHHLKLFMVSSHLENSPLKFRQWQWFHYCFIQSKKKALLYTIIFTHSLSEEFNEF